MRIFDVDILDYGYEWYHILAHKRILLMDTLCHY